MPTLLLMFVLDLAAIFFNGLLLLSCFRHEKKYRFFKKCWILLGLQVACQVVILIADAVEWWNGFRIQATESCNVLRVLSLSMMFFQITNLTAIMKVCYQHPSVHAEHKLYAVLFLGFIASAMIFWPWCFSKTAIFQVVHKAALLLTMSIDVYLVSVALAKDNAEYNEEFMSSKSDAAMDSRFLSRSWRAWTDNKKSLFVIVFLAACSVLIFSDVALARFESALWGRDLKGDTSIDGTVYLLILKFCLGTCLPLTLYDLINLSYPRKKGKGTITVTIWKKAYHKWVYSIFLWRFLLYCSYQLLHSSSIF